MSRKQPPFSEEEFALFQRLLVEESGLYFNKDRTHTLGLSLWERMQRHGHKTYQEYFHFLKFHHDSSIEMRELVESLTIGETYFFRNKPQFDALMKKVLPEIIHRKNCASGRSIRIWSAGCSKGDEAHSIAMAIIELLPSYRNWNISILGTDINRNVLSFAREGIYDSKDVGQMPQEYIDRYFTKKHDRYSLSDEVKSLVKFEYHNLAGSSYNMSEMADLDIIFCRNVTIYFDIPTTKKIINGFYDCLTNNGYLFLGHAETLWQINDKFQVIEFPQTFIYKKTLHHIKEKTIKPYVEIPKIKLEDFVPGGKKKVFNIAPQTEKTTPEKIEKRADTKEIETLYTQAVNLSNDKEYEKALSILNRIIALDKNHIGSYLAKANILANESKYKEAVNELEKITKVDNLHTEAYYLWGVLLCKIGDLKEAEAQFKKVIYIDPAIELAYFNLGNLYLYQNKFGKAGKEFANAVNLLERKPKDEQIKFCEDFTVEVLLRVCKNTLAKITKEVQIQ